MGEGPGMEIFQMPPLLKPRSLMLNAIDDGRMPPPASDPSCKEYIGYEAMTISQEERDLLSSWIDQGRSFGDPTTAPPISLTEYALDNPDLQMLIPESYTPEYASEDSKGNEYRCFVLEHEQEEFFYITAMHPLVDEAAIVHHIVLAKALRDSLSSEAFASNGVDCMSGAQSLVTGNGAGSGMIAVWAPGGAPIRFDDAGILVQPNDVFILQLHYYQADPSQRYSDRSGYLMETASKLEQTILMAPYGYHNFTIPTNDPSHTTTLKKSLRPQPLKIWASFPHMHLLGTEYNLSVQHQDGNEECVVHSDKYDFNNQLTYQFEDPIVVREGDSIFWECTWNNSTSNPYLYYDPPQDIGYGERTDEEMCYAFTLISLGE